MWKFTLVNPQRVRSFAASPTYEQLGEFIELLDRWVFIEKTTYRRYAVECVDGKTQWHPAHGPAVSELPPGHYEMVLKFRTDAHDLSDADAEDYLSRRLSGMVLTPEEASEETGVAPALLVEAYLDAVARGVVTYELIV